MRTLNFASRNFKEIIRDPLSIIFAILLPLFLLFIFQQFKIPNEVYKIENFTPGIIIFSFSFISLFTATLVANDRSTSLLTRLCASPMKTIEYIGGYVLSIMPLVIIQNVLFFISAIILGLDFNINVIYTILISLPISLLFIMLGILIGCISTEKSASGISSVVVQLVAFTSGMYFSTEMVGEVFNFICDILPFKGTLDITKAFLNADYSGLCIPIITVVIYTIIVLVLACILFRKRLQSDNK